MDEGDLRDKVRTHLTFGSRAGMMQPSEQEGEGRS